jgi:uncharacterized membrane protein YtjA (UPF0391 family)
MPELAPNARGSFDSGLDATANPRGCIGVRGNLVMPNCGNLAVRESSDLRDSPEQPYTAWEASKLGLPEFAGEAKAEVRTMLWTIFVILLVLWLLGVVSSYTLGGFIHILLVIALVVLLIQLISGRRPVV